MPGASKTTTDHHEIKRWAESHGGKPAAVKGTGRGGDPGMLRIDFPGFSGERSLRPISWDDFFKWFDTNELALVYRQQDRFNKLISRTTAEARGRGERRTTQRRAQAGLSPQRRAAETRKRVEARRARAETGARSSERGTAKKFEAGARQATARKPARKGRTTARTARTTAARTTAGRARAKPQRRTAKSRG